MSTQEQEPTEEQKTHWKKQFNYNYLGSHSLPPGKDMILTIRETKKEMVKGGDGKEKECFVAHFKEDVKPMILNKTNCKIIARLLKTPLIENWLGNRVQVYVASVEAFGTETDALRIRDFLPKEPIDTSIAQDYLKACKNLEQLKETYFRLPKNMQESKAVIKLKDQLKSKLK